MCYNIHLQHHLYGQHYLHGEIMSTPLYMTTDDAIQIVREYAMDNSIDDFDEALTSIELSYDDLEKDVRVAYRTVVASRNDAFGIN